ncbi:cytochrome P450 [Candidatus Uabimicrobium amorphum]|uniref:Cytochrome P450 n=1 Tax=Uabimicrobium amorphum TaxID=2596890 RepID=A0A5S9F548_UABAM|nr:cytochrome P450 [Candidatus Uabimicrobium amorphum]BBM85174.1 cytochrome P450 [Candidatus Uabimicrobium amorphum]
MSKKYDYPKGPRMPSFVQTFHWFFRVYPFLTRCAERFSSPIRLKFLGFGKVVMFSDPQSIREIFLGDTNVLFAGEGNSLLEPFLGKNSLLILDQERHLRERRLLLPPFHGERMRHYGQFMQDISEKIMDKWPVGKPFAVDNYLQEISLEVILRVVFGIEDQQKFVTYKKAILALLRHMDGFGALVLFLPVLQKDLGRFSRWGRFQNDMRKFNDLIYEELKGHSTESGEDILSLLINATYEDGSKMQPPEIRDQLLTALLAGHETTATALAWALYWLDKTPRVYQKLCEELDSVDEWDAKTLSRLPYLDAVCKETLRLNPVIPIVARRLQQDYTVNGYHLSKGTLVAPCIFLTHHREDLYPNPQEFRPERFIERKYSPYEFLPFGGGVRKCIGAAFATYEMKLVLATILRRFSIKLKNTKLKMKRRSVVITPGKLQLVVHER